MIDQSSVDNAFGFRPIGNILRTRIYAVATAPTINVSIQDLVIAGGANVSTPWGYKMIIEDGAVPDGNAGFLGSVMAVFDENMYPISYIAAARVGNGTIAGYVLVADHPYQLYVAQEDGEGNAIDLSEGSMNANIISATLCAPNTTTYMSTQEIDSDSANTTAALNVKLIEVFGDDTPADDTNHYCRYVCQINEHFYGDTIAGL